MLFHCEGGVSDLVDIEAAKTTEEGGVSIEICAQACGIDTSWMHLLHMIQQKQFHMMSVFRG